MRDDHDDDEVPAALPLILFVAGLAAGPHIAFQALTVCGAIAIALLIGPRHVRLAASLVLFAVGVMVSLSHRADLTAEQAVIAHLPPERFVVIEAPIASDWSRNGAVFSLRTLRFSAGGRGIEQPLTIYTRFPPSQIGMERTIRVQGLLRADDHGRFAVHVKSPRLMTYSGRLNGLAPAAWNRFLANRLRRYAPQFPEETAMIEALCLGRGERLSNATRDSFKRGGTYHLLVFSGLQIALAAAAIAFLLRWIGAPRASDWSLLVFALLAPMFIGPTASVTRSSIGIALYALSRILKRPTSFENLWCVAALLRLVVVPSDLTDPAFHLTFAGAGALLFIGKPLSASGVRWAAYAIGAELAIAPLTLFHFHQYALGGSLMTIVMTPIVLIMLLIGAAFCATELTLLLHAIAFLNGTCEWLNGVVTPFSGFFAAPPVIVLIPAFTVAVAAISISSRRLRTMVIIACLVTASLGAIARHITSRTVVEPRVTFLDVGQGDAILIRSGIHTALIDGGGRGDDERFGESTLMPMLVDRGIQRLDLVILSHAHPDHCGGLPAVLRHLVVRQMRVSPQRFRGDCAQRVLDAGGDRVRLLRTAMTASVGEIRLTLMPPLRAYRRAPENNGSIVVQAVAGGRSFLFTGDIEREAEADLASLVRHADVLKVAHHGSRTSTTRPFLDAVSPRLAVISCGRNNLFGHPHGTVLAALAGRGVRTWRTDQSGAVEVTVTGRTLRVKGEIDTPR